VRRFFTARDEVAWQSVMPRDTSFRVADVRNHLTFRFPREAGADTAYLCVNAGTAMWGSTMIRHMLELRGEKVDDWYANVDARGVELLRLGGFILREELFVLKVKVREGDAWVERGYIAGSGPFMSEDRVCVLDVSSATGDSLQIRLDPPVGYWSLDHAAVTYTAPAAPELQYVSARRVTDQDGADVSVLDEKDGRYHVMPETGQYLTAEFPVPEQRGGTERSVFLRTTGYYRLHLPEDTPEQTALIEDLMNTPGKIVTYGLEEYIRMLNPSEAMSR
jgi:hypothetical protein